MDKRLTTALDDSNYFWEVLHVLFYKDADESDYVTELNMDMFREFCSHIQSTYQTLFAGTENPRLYIQFAQPYIRLTEISLFPVYLDRPHDILQTFAELVCDAIYYICFVGSNKNQLIIPSNNNLCCSVDSGWNGWDVLYDFEKDTPEDIWNRIDMYLSAQELE